ncbi:hypothetical protein LguiA_012842 [Lonicera macranthoides]
MEIQAKKQELKVDEVDHVDFIGVDKYNFHPQHQLGSSFNELRRIELKIDNIEHIDFIGVDRFDVHPNFLLIEFFNKLRRITLQHDLNFEEFCFTRRIKCRRYSKYLFLWQGRKELSHIEFRRKNEKYSKYLFYWHGRFQILKLRPNAELVKDWLNREMGRPDWRTNLLEDEGYDVILPNPS